MLKRVNKSRNNKNWKNRVEFIKNNNTIKNVNTKLSVNEARMVQAD